MVPDRRIRPIACSISNDGHHDGGGVVTHVFQADGWISESVGRKSLLTHALSIAKVKFKEERDTTYFKLVPCTRQTNLKSKCEINLT